MGVDSSQVDLGRGGGRTLVDLTQPLSEHTPVIPIPEPYEGSPRFAMHEISRYDDRGPVAYWNWFVAGEHVGTHFDAPCHWVSGQGGETVDQVDPRWLLTPAVVLDRVEECEKDPDYLLDIPDVEQFEDQHGPLPDGGWLLYRTGWGRYAHDEERFLNADERGCHTPGVTARCAQWLAEERPICGFGVETVGTDSGLAWEQDPPFPMHHYLHGAGKYGLTQLANLERLPETGITLIVAPLRIVGGSGSPARVFALM